MSYWGNIFHFMSKCGIYNYTSAQNELNILGLETNCNTLIESIQHVIMYTYPLCFTPHPLVPKKIKKLFGSSLKSVAINESLKVEQLCSKSSNHNLVVVPASEFANVPSIRRIGPHNIDILSI